MTSFENQNNLNAFMTEINLDSNNDNRKIEEEDFNENPPKENSIIEQYKKISKIRKELLKPILPLPFDGLAIKQRKLKYIDMINKLIPSKIEGRNENFLLFEKDNYPLIDLISCRKTTNNSNLLLKHLLISNQYELPQNEQNTINNKSYKLPIKSFLNKKSFKNLNNKINIENKLANEIKNCLSISQNKRYKNQSTETPNKNDYNNKLYASISFRGDYKKNNLREHYISLENNEFFRKEKFLQKFNTEGNNNDLNKYRKDLSNSKYNNHLRIVSPTVQKIHLPPLNLNFNNQEEKENY